MTLSKLIRVRGVVRLCLGALLVLAASTAGAATIVIINNDGAGEGFNDPTPRAAVPGNAGTTLGQQRLNIFQHAANIWGGILSSNVTIQVRAQFNPQTCTATSAVLGSAGPLTAHMNFTNAPLTGHWYHQALANKLATTDQSAAQPDITATFNSSIDSGCFGPGLVWYYGTDGNEGTNLELLPVVLHELGHGLGFSTTTSGSTGGYNGGFPHVWDHYLLDNSIGLHWDEMSATQRVASAIAIDHLAWDGPYGIAEAATLGPRPVLTVNSPGAIAGVKTAQLASFGPQSFSLTGNVALVDDGTPDNADACEPILNGGALAGKIALIHRGTCTFVAKSLAAQAAGAIGVLIANNVTPGPAPMGGTDPAVTIPCMGITLADGNAIEAELLNGPVNVKLGFSATLKAGADAAGRPLMYTPSPFASGSSVSHWDTSMIPNALMEPAINSDLHNTIDLAHGLFVDIGWFRDAVDVAPDEVAASRSIAMEAPVPNPATSSTSVAFRIGTADRVQLTITDVSGRTIRRLHDGAMSAGRHVQNWDGRTDRGGLAPAGVYFIRLQSAVGAKTQRVTLVR